MSPRLLRQIAFSCVLSIFASTLSGCATPPAADDPDALAEYNEANDPLEPTNRAIYDFNDGAYTYVFRPAIDGYRFVLPPVGRQMVASFLANLKAPVILFNDVLQGNFPRAKDAVSRFVLNSTFGVGGIMDVAAPLGIPRHDADFGQTLAVWGVGEGPYLMLPLIGPSNPRDAGGLLVDSFADPLDDYLQTQNLTWLAEVRFGASVFSQLDALADPLDEVKRNSLDPYTTIRSLARQRRLAEINQVTTPTVGWAHFMPHWSLNFSGIF
jgi:phospholipid-binding lipoprotein MlaA